MSNNFKENRKTHLEKYAREKKLPVGGSFNGKGHYGHILKTTKATKIKDIEQYNLIGGLNFDGFIPANKIHMFAHHLNSSQVLCYNYFRPMLNDDGTPKRELIDLLKQNGITISERARCYFEYEHSNTKYKNPDTGKFFRLTEFDFYVIDVNGGGVEVFFEIKYTENGFGKANNDQEHQQKFNIVYGDLLKNCKCLLNLKVDQKVFLKNYQLYRNVLRITDKNKYTVFVTAKGNDKTFEQLKAFLPKIKEDYKNNVICLYWEDLINKKHKLYEKYIAE